MKITIEKWDNGRLLINSCFAHLLRDNNIHTAEDLWKIKSEPVKNVVPDRGTARIWLKDAGTGRRVETYIKRYQPFTLTDAMKAIMSLKKPVAFDAIHEWNALLSLNRIEIPTITPIAAARTGGHTCNLTLGIDNFTRASDLLKAPDLALTEKRRVCREIARIAGLMHKSGFAHQDFYLVHFFVSNATGSIFLIDLQRMISQSRLADRWRVKDLAQLLFSAGPFITSHDIARFMVAYSRYSGLDWRSNRRMISAIRNKAKRIKKHHMRRYQQ